MPKLENDSLYKNYLAMSINDKYCGQIVFRCYTIQRF